MNTERSYNPPSEKNWVYTHRFDDEYRQAYIHGYIGRQVGKTLDDNPHEPSGHERETTFSDELNQWWYSGWMDGNDDVLNCERSST